MTEAKFFTSVDNVAARFSRFFVVVSIAVVLWRMLELAEEQQNQVLLVFGWPAFVFAALLAFFQFGAVVQYLIDEISPKNNASWWVQFAGGFLATLCLVGLVMLCLMIFSIRASGVDVELGL